MKATGGKTFTIKKTKYYNVTISCSSIHDHANSHCFMKMLQGSLKETQYYWPDNNDKNIPLKQKFSTMYNTDEVTYINGKLV